MASSGKAKEKDIAPEEPEHLDHDSGSDEEDDEIDHTLPEASTPSTSSNKKKKKRSKALKALNSLRGKDSIPQEVVKEVLARVNAEQAIPGGTDEATVREALEQMKLKDMLQGKASVGGKNKKDVGTHKVCSFAIPV